MKTLLAVFSFCLVDINVALAEITIGSLKAEAVGAFRQADVVAQNAGQLVVESRWNDRPAQIAYYFQDGKVDEIVCAFHMENFPLESVLPIYEGLLKTWIGGKRYLVDIKLFGIRLTRDIEVTTAAPGDYILGIAEFDADRVVNLRILLKTLKDGSLVISEFGFSITRGTHTR